jgi:hypothetical protein
MEERDGGRGWKGKGEEETKERRGEGAKRSNKATTIRWHPEISFIDQPGRTKMVGTVSPVHPPSFTVIQ